ncbi:flagellar biosynthesis/type III secretory pathway lipoprotein, partial [Singulisphaera rosea]
WLAGLGVLAAILAFGYMATAPASGKYLGGGRSYTSGDRDKITRTLDAEGIPYRVVDQCIDVSADRFEEASAILSKLDLGPHSPTEIRRRTQASGLWKSFETASEREQRDLEVREEILESLIAKFNGIESVFVRLNRIRTYQGLRPVSMTSASVDLDTEDNRELNPDVVQAIQNVIVANEPEVKADAVSVIARGRFYLKAGNPTVGAISRTRAREDEIRRQVSDELSWIKGLQVSVRLVPAPPPPPK